MSVPDLLVQPLLALFPHGFQHGARRNAYQAMGLAAAARREREEADAHVAAVTSPVVATARRPALVTAR